MGAPQDKPEAIKGWLASGVGYPLKTMVTVTKAKVNGKSVQTCTFAVGDVDGREFQTALLSRLKTESLGDSNDGMQEMHSYLVNIAGSGLMVNIVLPVDRTAKVFTVSAVPDFR
jgi:hypothetical protein